MTNADKMFKELGYQDIGNDTFVMYDNFNCINRYISFDEKYNNVIAWGQKTDTDYATVSAIIKTPELKAINEKCKELRVVK